MKENETVVDEVEKEEEVSEDSAETSEAEPEKDALTLAQEEAGLYKDRWMRLAAEFENYKKRTAREFEAMVQSANEDLIRDLLPILDGVGRALAHHNDGQDETEGYQAGVTMIMEQFPKVLQNRNLKEIETVGQPFDPNIHEALMQVVSDTVEAGHVTDEVEKGYCLGDKVLRPAKVVVSQGKAEETSEN